MAKTTYYVYKCTECWQDNWYTRELNPGARTTCTHCMSKDTLMYDRTEER